MVADRNEARKPAPSRGQFESAKFSWSVRFSAPRPGSNLSRSTATRGFFRERRCWERTVWRYSEDRTGFADRNTAVLAQSCAARRHWPSLRHRAAPAPVPPIFCRGRLWDRLEGWETCSWSSLSSRASGLRLLLGPKTMDSVLGGLLRRA